MIEFLLLAAVQAMIIIAHWPLLPFVGLGIVALAALTTEALWRRR